MKHYDAIMIGFGKGAKTLAKVYAVKGKQVAMIEQSDKMYGGTCINVGCIPTKSLIVGADKYTYEASMQRKNELTSALRKKNYDMLDQFENVDIYTATVQFIDDHTLHLTGAKDEQIQGDEIFINTGSTPILPDIEGVNDTKNIFTSAELMDLAFLPKRLAIIGGGYIGLEFSSMYARYGAQVTVFEHGERLVKREDEDIAAQIQNVLEKQGVCFQFSSSVQKFENAQEEVLITYRNAHGEVVIEHFDAVLLATGRKANTEQLHLEKAGVAVDHRGSVIVDTHLRTSVPHIHAMGDVKGGLQFTYISLDDYRIVYDDLFAEGKRTTENRGAIAYSVFISPTFSRVGLSEQEAKAAGYEVLTSTLPAAAIPRANVNQKTDGILKAVVDAKTNQILGCVLFCDASEEIINFVQLAMNQNVTADVIKNHIFTHPTMSEALNDLFAKYNEIEKERCKMSNVIHANDSDFDSYIQEGVTLVDFFATWCGPCKMLGPEIEKLADAYAGKAKIVKVDVDQAQQIAMRYQVQSIPTLIIFVNGEVAARDMGFKPYPQLEKFLNSHLA